MFRRRSLAPGVHTHTHKLARTERIVLIVACYTHTHTPRRFIKEKNSNNTFLCVAA